MVIIAGEHSITSSTSAGMLPGSLTMLKNVVNGICLFSFRKEFFDYHLSSAFPGGHGPPL